VDRNSELLGPLRLATRQDRGWQALLAGIGDHALHLAILVEPYLSLILDGQKRVESRFSIHRSAPYGRLQRGDVVLLKRSSGPIVGACRAGAVWFYQLDTRSFGEIRNGFTEALCAQDPRFWSARAAASYATLVQLDDVCRLPPISIPKRDRRGWVVLRPRSEQRKLELR
jgi:hypothetical protein